MAVPWIAPIVSTNVRGPEGASCGVFPQLGGDGSQLTRRQGAQEMQDARAPDASTLAPCKSTAEVVIRHLPTPDQLASIAARLPVVEKPH